MNVFKFAIGFTTSLLLISCGGGGGSPGVVANSTGTAAAAGVPVASSFVFSLDKSSIPNGDTDRALLTITALDASRNVLKDQDVLVSVDSGAYTPLSTKTDTNGLASGNISIGGDKSNRDINVTMKVGGLSGTAVVTVTGSQITLTPLPSTLMPGARAEILVKVTDASGAGIPAKSIQMGGTLGLSQTAVTGSSGTATIVLAAAPAATGTYTVTASGLGVTASRDVLVASGTSGVPAAVGVISSASVAVSPNSIPPNTVGVSTSRTGIRAVFQNAQNQAVQNVRVRFEIAPPGLGSGEQISTGALVVYSDQNGVASAEYIAGTRSSPTNGVTIRACYAATDLDLAGGLCPSAVFATLTVAGQPLSVTLGDNNKLQRGANDLTYIKLFDIAVADAAGNAVANAVLSASVDITTYGKGRYTDGAGSGTTAGFSYQATLSPTAVPSATAGRVLCLNEDLNRNGFLDTGEDIDGNGILFPRKADVIVSFVGTNKTAANGRATIQVEYPQNVATWLFYNVKVTTNVAGSEGTVVKSYVTEFIEGDDKNGSFLTPPFGVGSCVSPF